MLPWWHNCQSLCNLTNPLISNQATTQTFVTFSKQVIFTNIQHIYLWLPTWNFLLSITANSNIWNHSFQLKHDVFLLESIWSTKQERILRTNKTMFCNDKLTFSILCRLFMMLESNKSKRLAQTIRRTNLMACVIWSFFSSPLITLVCTCKYFRKNVRKTCNHGFTLSCHIQLLLNVYMNVYGEK